MTRSGRNRQRAVVANEPGIAPQRSVFPLMNSRENPLFWSFPCGTLFRTRMRISVYFPLIVVTICIRLQNVQLGLAFSGILFLSVLLHEFGHILAARRTGGSGDEILLWPLGGLAVVRPASTFASRFLTAAGGPLVNAAICGITLSAVLQAGRSDIIGNPLVFPIADLSGDLLSVLLILTFWCNGLLLLLNLIPVYPLDGGRMLLAALQVYMPGERARAIYIRVGFFVGMIGIILGLMQDSTWVLLIGAIVLILNIQEWAQMRTADAFDESFMGYDFSEGYTSLERPDSGGAPKGPGLFRRWIEKRRAEKLRKQQQNDTEVAQTLDELLQKVHSDGIESLTHSERQQLNRASDHLREKGRQPDL